MDLPLSPPVDPMLAKLTRAVPDGPGWWFEPKWDGFRCVVFRDGDELELWSRNRRPLGRYFPELLDPLAAALPERCVVDGEIVVPDGDDRGLDFDALLQRIHPARSRVETLAVTTPAAFVAFDLLAVDDRSLLAAPLSERRTTLVDRVHTSATVHVTPASVDRDVAMEWFSTFEGAGLDGVIAKRLDDVYSPGARTMAKVKHERSAICALVGYRVHKDGQGVGSLILGLHDDDGDLHQVGVAASFTAKFRAELLEDLASLRLGASDNHPWVAADASGADAPPGGGSRWNAGKDLSWTPVRMERVVEVRFGQLESGRFRHGVRFVQWRPDRTPADCRYDQLDVARPVRFADLFTGPPAIPPAD